MASYHYGTPNEPHKSEQGWQYDDNRKTPKKERDTWGGIITLFVLGSFGLWPLFIPAIFKLVRKLSDAGQEQQRAKAAAQKSTSQGKPTSREKMHGVSNHTVRKNRDSAGLGKIVAGGILTAVFGIATTAATVEFFESLLYGYFFADEITGVIILAAFLAGSAALLLNGIGSRRAAERYSSYLAYIGANREVNLAYMAASFDVPVKKLCKDLRTMLAKGILPTGYLDLSAGKLFLTEMGYHAPKEDVEEKKSKENQSTAGSDSAILLEIRQVNDSIPDEVMTEKIARIEEITGKILTYQKTHPNKAGELRSFLNYYLPTTLKILRAYAQLDAQGIEGENITASKKRIEGMMDQVVSGFEKQLDKLFQDAAMDINSDVQVLENMLKKDGLSDEGEGMTMTF